MNFKNFMSLTLFSLVVISTSAFSQIVVNTELVKSQVTSPSPGTTNFFKPYDPFAIDNSLGFIPGSGVLLNNNNNFNGAYSGIVIRERKFPTYCSGNNCSLTPRKTFSLPGLVQNRLISNDLVNYAEDQSKCEMAPATSLDQLAEATDISNCYKDRTAAENYDPNNDYALLSKDMEICNCLAAKGETVPALKEIMLTNLSDLRAIQVGDVNAPTVNANNSFDFFKDNAQRVREKMDQNSDALAFQASLFTSMMGTQPQDQGRVAAFARAYSISSVGAWSEGTRTASGAAGAGTGSMVNINFFGRRDRKGVSRILHLGKQDAPVVDESVASGNIVLTSLGANATGFEQEVGQRIGADAGPKPSETTKSDLNRRASEVLTDMARPGIPDRRLFRPEDINPETKQCLSAREFMGYQQIPSDADVIKELARDASPEQWNPKKLRADYDALMKLPMARREMDKKLIVTLKAKIKFLERNPMIKNFLGANEDGLDEYLEKKPATRANKIRASYLKDEQGKSLAQRKSDLLSLIKQTVPPAGCTSPQCIADHMKSGAMKDVGQNVLKFFANPSNADVTTVENERANIALSNDFFAKPEKIFAQEPTAYTRPAIIESFTNSYPLGTPDSCDEESKLDICVRTYAGYCQVLRDKFPKVEDQKIKDRALVDDLDAQVADFFETDINKNEELKKWNDAICNTQRRTSPSDTSGDFPTFWQYREKICRTAQPAGTCEDTPQAIQKLRTDYITAYPVPADPSNNDPSVATIMAFNSLMKGSGIGQGVSQEAFDSIAKGRVGGTSGDADFDDMNRSWGFDDNVSRSRVGDSSSDDALASGTTATTAKIDNRIDNSSVIDDASSINNFSNYSNIASNQSTVNGSGEPQKIENMNEPQRQELLDDWQKEYDSWKKNKGNDNSAAASANEAAMKSRIEALEQLLAQQKKLTEDQYRLLNDAIANQNKPQQNAVAQNEEGNSSSSNGRNRSPSSVSGSDESEDVVSRNAASVPEQKFNTGGANGGAGSAGVGGGSSRRSGGSAASSDDSVAREEAKLVNLRRSSDGSITIESANTASSGSAIALSVPLSDEQYRALAANPQGFNLSQIENAIPKDQIAKLEKSGGEITILLRNGSNPPFEVKVEKKNNKLVYTQKNGKEQTPVRRVFTRQALELQLKANR